mgnify:CR=1 FL=1
MNDKCDTCGNKKITYYKQKRADGVWVVTARCGNWHHPIKGKPFYSVVNFKLETLPVLPATQPYPEQQDLFQPKKIIPPYKNFPFEVK